MTVLVCALVSRRNCSVSARIETKLVQTLASKTLHSPIEERRGAPVVADEGHRGGGPRYQTATPAGRRVARVVPAPRAAAHISVTFARAGDARDAALGHEGERAQVRDALQRAAAAARQRETGAGDDLARPPAAPAAAAPRQR
eukprot:3568192-Pyramimonas_sp.AAC.1